MDELEKYKKSFWLYRNEVDYIQSFNVNLTEGLRTILKQHKSSNIKSEFNHRWQSLVMSIVIIAIGSTMEPLTIPHMFFIVLGIVLFATTIYGILELKIMHRRKKI